MEDQVPLALALPNPLQGSLPHRHCYSGLTIIWRGQCCEYCHSNDPEIFTQATAKGLLITL
jgi:hypothetical protein